MSARSLLLAAGFIAVAMGWSVPALCAKQSSIPQAPANLQPQHVSQQTSFVKGQFIVKFKSQGPHALTACVHCLLAHRQAFRQATRDRSDSLDQLNERYGVTAARHLGIHREEIDGDETDQGDEMYQQYTTHHAQVRQRFSRRAVRAPHDLTVPDLSQVYVMTVNNTANVPELCRRYQADPHVEYAHPDYRVQVLATPNDPFYLSYGSWAQTYLDLWGLRLIQAAQAWDVSTGSGVVVAVIDTGLARDHEDIADNVWMNPGEVPGNGEDDDHNGFIDDVYGWDFTTCAVFSSSGCVTEKLRNANPNDTNGHGTHVAGTIAAVGNNGRGIIGVAPEAHVMALKGLNAHGEGLSSDLADAIVYAADNGADILNNSWGGPDAARVLQDAIAYADAQGCVIVAAAGNEYTDALRVIPANLPHVVTVAAMGPDGRVPLFSNGGANIDVAAPGVDILSLRAPSTNLTEDSSRVVSQRYVRADGTSMAAPHVSGVAALVLAQHPTMASDDVRQILRTSATDLQTTADPVDGPGWDVRSGYGKLNASKAVQVEIIPKAVLDAPARGSLLLNEGVVTIHGTASGPGFDRFELSFRRLPEQQWRAMAGAIAGPVENGVLATWDVSTLSDGVYHVLLTVISTDGTTAYDLTEWLVIHDANVKTDWPVTIEESIGMNAPIAGDLDGDGVLECLLSGSHTLYVLNTAGQLLWQRSFEGVISGPSVADVNGDGTNEVVLHEAQETTGFLHVLTRDGEPLPGWPITVPQHVAWLPALAVSIADLDQNGRVELLLPIPFDQLYIFTNEGQPVGSYFNMLNGPCAIGDLNHDGRLEVVVVNNLEGGGRQLRALSSTSAGLVELGGLWPIQIEAPDAPYSTGVSFRGPVLGDLNGDGNLEIVVPTQGKLHVYQANGLPAPGWPQTLARLDDIGHVALGDVDGDRNLEIVLGTWASGIYVFKYTGSRTRFTGVLGDAFEASPVIADIDGDGDGEILINSITFKQHGAGDGLGRVYAYDYDPSVGLWQLVWSKSMTTVSSFEQRYFASPVVADMDGDGTLELLVASPWYTRSLVNVWALPSSRMHEDALMWPMCMHDVQHTSFLPHLSRNHPPVLMAIADQVRQEGEPILISVRASDPDEDALTYTATNLPSDAQFLPLGDANADGRITIDDIALLTEALYGPLTPTPFQQTVLDLDGDHQLSPNDLGLLIASLILQHVQGCVFSWVPNFDQGGWTYAVTFRVSDGHVEDYEPMSILVNETPVRIFGTIVDAASQPVPGVTVQLRRGSHRWRYLDGRRVEATTDALGQFALTDLEHTRSIRSVLARYNPRGSWTPMRATVLPRRPGTAFADSKTGRPYATVLLNWSVPEPIPVVDFHVVSPPTPTAQSSILANRRGHRRSLLLLRVLRLLQHVLH